MLGWPAYVAAAAGTVLLWRSGLAGRLVALLPLVLLVPTGLLSMAQVRFILPALPFLEIAAAYAIVRFAVWAGGRLRGTSGSGAWKAQTAVAAAAAALCAAWPAPELIAARASLRLEDTRHVARRWIEASLPASDVMALDVYGPAFDRAKDQRLTVPWPFLATQAPLVRIAYDPLWLDGFRYYVTSSEVVSRFEAAADRYPREAAFYRWIRERGTLVWSSASAGASGPLIEVRSLPERTGTRAARESLWADPGVGQIYKDRLAKWCHDTATAFLFRNDYPRAEEWAQRGLSIPRNPLRRELLEARSGALVRLGRAEEGERSAAEGIRDFPASSLLHLNRAIALEALYRPREAIEEYRAVLKLSPKPAAAELVRSQILRLEGEAGRERR
jgi:tetratricopeptide (TPR) repeat protein